MEEGEGDPLKEQGYTTMICLLLLINIDSKLSTSWLSCVSYTHHLTADCVTYHDTGNCRTEDFFFFFWKQVF